jgi:phosphoribosyl-ATP pyrophosphohydrolase
MYTNDELQIKIEQWSYDRGILTNGNPITQAMKLFEEGGELASALAKEDKDEAEDAIGDMVVVLTNIAKLIGSDINKCTNLAYDNIKDRKGFLTDEGIFIKETDPNYSKYVDTRQTVMEFN